MNDNLDDLRAKLEILSGITDEHARPSAGILASIVRDIDLARLNTKFFGYELAHRIARELPEPTGTSARVVGLTSKASTQADLESEWAAHWMRELRIARVMHRKIWEVCFLLQALHEFDLLRPGARGLGFGVGSEAIPSYLASCGVEVTVTDLPPTSHAAQGWLSTNQWAEGAARLFYPDLVSREAFDQNILFRFEDMNEISSDLVSYDFCWSLCALEHLGTIAKGLAFIENSLGTVKPGGIVVHTTEFNFSNDRETIDNWSTVLFQRAHFIDIAARLEAAGHKVRPLDFNIGRKPMDRFIDLPPYLHQLSPELQAWWGGDERHVKLSIDGFACTCFGLIIQKS
ncbi:MAG TPA: hypothetical protein VGN82_09200 [Bosea sp. (in: a-proteobacteria)]|jgi:hypothetical protein|uniref:hypothetical protein n=1 Tax=Bosea sp. (in: a-proteobacteria) TaxID=1871050 RepID=UPI002E1293FC|nr:hypothetical protein [Bosea sp. (in: a-proteobacteria)]